MQRANLLSQSMSSVAPIILIHGLFGHLNDPAILSAFGNREVHAPDQIGYGALRDADTSSLTLVDQVDRLATFVRENELAPAHLVGHSVGGAVAVLVASAFSDLVASVVSVEGNFTMEDAFWSAEIAKKPLEEVEGIVEEYFAAPDAWIAATGVPINDWTSALAISWLKNQPASTIKAQAAAVVEATSDPAYLESVRQMLDSDMPFHLIAGERSASGWGVPDWVRQRADSDITIRGAGHLMMVENPSAFARSAVAALGPNGGLFSAPPFADRAEGSLDGFGER